MSPLSEQYISGPGVSTDELLLMQVCLIRKSWKMCSVGVPPGTGSGNTGIDNEIISTFWAEVAKALVTMAWLSEIKSYGICSFFLPHHLQTQNA